MNLSELYKLRSIVDEINTMIETTLLLDRRDIEKAVSEANNLNGDDGNEHLIRALAHGLQQFDIFEQRLKNVMEINYAVSSNETEMPDVIGCGNNIFALNQLQYEAAWRDYLNVISELQSIARAGEALNSPRMKLASNGKLLRASMPLVSNRFSKLIELTQGKACVDLVCYLRFVEQLYSTERERTVLTTFAA